MAKNILVIDDSETSLYLLQSILDENPGYDNILEKNSMHAFETLKERDVDLIFLDLMMPGMTGYEFLEKIQADPELKNIPVIILSAMHDDGSEKKAKNMGAADYMKKPLDVDELEEKMRIYLDSV
jgi:CheY-like chemotaxis protein